jgi:hypothetical protein
MVGEVVDDALDPKIDVMDPDPEIPADEMRKQIPTSFEIVAKGRIEVVRMVRLGPAIRMLDYQIQKGSNAKLVSAKEELMKKLNEHNEIWKRTMKLECFR